MADEVEEVVEEVEPVEEPVETPVEPEAADEPSGELPWYSELSELGFEGVDSEESARERAVAALRDLRAAQESLKSENENLRSYVGYGQQYLALQSDPEYREFLTRKNAPKSEPVVEPKAWWSPPVFNAELAKKYWKPRHNPETGQTTFGWSEDTPLELRSAAEQHSAYIEDWATRLQTEPDKALPPVVTQTFADALSGNDPRIVDALNAFLDRRLSDRDREREQQSFLNQVSQEHSSWLYERDPITNAAKVDAQGNYVLTARGKRAVGYVNDIAESGVSDVRKQWELAEKLARLESLESAAGSQAAQATAQQVRQQKKQQLLKNAATSVPQRGGKALEPGRVPRSSSEGWESFFRQQLEDNAVFAN